MKHFTLALCLFLPLFSFAQEEIEYKEYSYSELFQMIEEEKDSIFELKNALIKVNPETDQRFIFSPNQRPSDRLDAFSNQSYESRDTIIIDKEIDIRDVEFESGFTNESGVYMQVVLSHIHYKKRVSFWNAFGMNISESRFDDDFRIIYYNNNNKNFEGYRNVSITRNAFQVSFSISSGDETASKVQLFIVGNTLQKSDIISNILVQETTALLMHSNQLEADVFSLGVPKESSIFNNVFNCSELYLEVKGRQYFTDNSFGSNIALEFEEVSTGASFDWNQIHGNVFSREGYVLGSEKYALSQSKRFDIDSDVTDEKIQVYFDSIVPRYKTAYDAEQKLRGALIDFYNRQNNIENKNAVYIDSKDLETKRLAYLYKTDPHFNTFFKWKINQFLKIFSAYGTEPARAIVFSVYVIIAFALIYLFFPNHWDSHGKNRIMDRYRFFAKYMKKDSGIHEVYLDEKREEMMAAEDFRAYMLKSKQEIPGFFMATALPLYRWSVAGTRTFSWLLSKVDVLKGTWSSTEDSKKAGKSVLIIGAFLIAIVYDLFIKMLNALMLSINTFTTLGFGEIPIKGLPRYLAIIQGFIGWFMLTIFSVSLISQLLN
ncbi:potassium channel family protein [Algoriphagus sp. SE2]|uniref:potassium channel family protein n=2 Tax=unclassified Algoriphagus TaxID=2641541 RepID=UPI0031CD6B22